MIGVEEIFGAAPTEASGAVAMSLGERAHREALQWEPFGQNHDPSFLRALREAYAEGFMRGFNTCNSMRRTQ